MDIGRFSFHSPRRPSGRAEV